MAALLRRSLPSVPFSVVTSPDPRRAWDDRSMTVLSLLDLRVASDALEQAPALIHETLAGTRARPGCLGVEVVVDVDDPTHFVFVEKWESLADDDAYRAWRETPEGAAVLGPILAGPPVLTRAVVRDEI